MNKLVWLLLVQKLSSLAIIIDYLALFGSNDIYSDNKTFFVCFSFTFVSSHYTLPSIYFYQTKYEIQTQLKVLEYYDGCCAIQVSV